MSAPAREREIRIGRVLVFSGIAAYFLSLALPAVTHHSEGTGFGYVILLLGWFDPAWWANPLALVALLLAAFRNRYAVIPGLFAGLLSLQCLTESSLRIEQGGLIWIVAIHAMVLGAWAESVRTPGEPDDVALRWVPLAALTVSIAAVLIYVAMPDPNVPRKVRLVTDADLPPRLLKELKRLKQPTCDVPEVQPLDVGNVILQVPVAPELQFLDADRLVVRGIALVHGGREYATTDETGAVVAVGPQRRAPTVTLSVTPRLEGATPQGAKFELATTAAPIRSEAIEWRMRRGEGPCADLNVAEKPLLVNAFVTHALADHKSRALPEPQPIPKERSGSGPQVVAEPLVSASCHDRLWQEQAGSRAASEFPIQGLGPFRTQGSDARYYLKYLANPGARRVLDGASRTDKYRIACSQDRAVVVSVLDRSHLEFVLLSLPDLRVLSRHAGRTMSNWERVWPNARVDLDGSTVKLAVGNPIGVDSLEFQMQ